MKRENNKIKYFLYARKSSESEDRQVQSIDDQIRLLKDLANNSNLKVVNVFIESKSAKKPNNRPIFEEMMNEIENGEADGILCWQINRLSRNPIDSARVQWLLQQGVLKSVQTIDKEYCPQDNVLMFNVESGMANQFILDLSKNVKRGIQSKLEKGWKPGIPPLGYLNDLINHTIVIDNERFILIRKSWDLLLSGNYSVPQILDILNNNWGFRTVKKKRIGNKPLSLSGLYKIFTNPFYMGIIVHKEKEYVGNHKKMITTDEYERAQIILGRKGKARPKKHLFPFTGIIRCGDCGCMITAEKKRKLIKSTKEIKEYTYYHCTLRKKEADCSQRESITQEDLENQIIEKIETLTIMPEFKDWALEVLNGKNDYEIKSRDAIYESQQKTLNETQKQLDNLVKMCYRELITDEEYLKEKEILQKDINKLRLQIKDSEERTDNWIKLTEEVFEFAVNARKKFINGDFKTKKEIINGLGSNWTLINKKISMDPHKWLVPIIENYSPLEKEYKALELDKKPLNKAQTEHLNSVIARWQGRKDSNPQDLFWREAVYR